MQPAMRKKRAEEEKRMAEVYTERSTFLTKWLWILFWLVIPSFVAESMSTFGLKSDSNTIHMVGAIMSALTSATYGAILLRISSVEEKYRPAGICTLAIVGISVLDIILNALNLPEVERFSLALAVPIIILGLYSTYKEFYAHAAVLIGIDFNLSEKWERLWKWRIRILIVTVVSFLLLFLSILLGLVLIFSCAIAALVLSILKLVYLYSTAERLSIYKKTHSNNQ